MVDLTIKSESKLAVPNFKNIILNDDPIAFKVKRSQVWHDTQVVKATVSIFQLN